MKINCYEVIGFCAVKEFYGTILRKRTPLNLFIFASKKKAIKFIKEDKNYFYFLYKSEIPINVLIESFNDVSCKGGLTFKLEDFNKRQIKYFAKE